MTFGWRRIEPLWWSFYLGYKGDYRISLVTASKTELHGKKLRCYGRIVKEALIREMVMFCFQDDGLSLEGIH